MSKKKTSLTQANKKDADSSLVPTELLADLRLLIEQTRSRVAQTVNSELVLLYWRIGKRINDDVLQNKRAGYGEQILPTLSAKLEIEFGKGFSARNLARMIQFAEKFPDERIVAILSQHLSWSHFVEIIPLKEDLKRDFYAEMCRVERWSVRALRNKINGMLFERTAIAKKPDQLIRKELAALRETDRLTPDLIFRDPYILDFLKLPAEYSEQELELAIIREIEKFLLELGTDFSFVARQKRMTIGAEDFYLDLLFYHRGLRRLVAIELMLGKFSPEYFGKITLYLRWLDKYERREGEEAPIGIVLCSTKDEEQIELLEIDKEGIRVGEYLTELPPREVLETKLGEAVRFAKARLLGEMSGTSE
jgi:predicted nuclease of restriction endonuclease-like (RecB) superfamily